MSCVLLKARANDKLLLNAFQENQRNSFGMTQNHPLSYINEANAGWRMKFSVLYDDMVIHIRTKGVDPDWIYDQFCDIANHK